MLAPIARIPGEPPMPSSVSASASASRSTWDDQIVPTLRKRLETESVYLSNRISATTFDDPSAPASASTSYHHTAAEYGPPSHPTAAQDCSNVPYSPTFGPPANHANHAAGGSGPSSPPSIPRKRTKSGPLTSLSSTSATTGTGTGTGVRPRQPSGTTGPPLFQSTATTHRGRGRENSLPTQNSSSNFNSPSSPSVSSPSSLPPSRIPTRPRSKSQLVSRPSPVHSNSTPPPLPSSIPILKSRSRSPQKRSIPLPSALVSTWASPDLHYDGDIQGGRTMAVAVHNRVVGPARGRGRDSPDLSLEERTREGFIKNELPPFKMLPEEALRIAERGHEIQPEEDWRGGRGSYEYDPSRSSLSDGERKRAITMKPSDHSNIPRLTPSIRQNEMERQGSPGSDGRDNRPSAAGGNKGPGYGISTSHTGLGMGMGMGHPSNNRHGASSKVAQRANSSRSPNLNSSTNTNGSFAAPRSASLNLLSSSSSSSPSTPNPLSHSQSRLGVAAHFIPPESNYTPPKGADWDEVVLPTVARKLGMGEERPSPVVSGDADEGELAVEWDKDGTPIRWVKKKARGLGESAASNSSPSPSDHTPTRAHAFSPTFEPSPDNPLHPRPPLSLRYQRSADAIELGQLRTSSGQTTTLGNQGADHMPSPSPLSANARSAYYPGKEAPSLNKKPSGNLGGMGYGNVNGSNPSIGRKPSLLRKQPTPTVSRQGSEMSLRNQYTRPSHGGNGGYAPPANLAGPGSASGERGNMTGTPGMTHRITDAIYENHLQHGPASGTRPGGREDEGSHGKGCGCLIM